MNAMTRKFLKKAIANNLKPVLTTKVIEMVTIKDTILEMPKWTSIEVGPDDKIIEIIGNSKPATKTFISQSVIEEIQARNKGFMMLTNKVRS